MLAGVYCHRLFLAMNGGLQSNHMKKLIITAGHSLTKGGASANGLKEEFLAIELRDLITDAIYQLDPTVKVWEDTDTDPLSVVIAKTKAVATKDDILFDVHFNSASNKATAGTEAFIAVNAREKSRRIAERITELTAGMLQTKNRGVKLENQSQHSRLGMLHSAASSVLYEVQFISNPQAMATYNEMKERLATGIANILIQELNK